LHAPAAGAALCPSCWHAPLCALDGSFADSPACPAPSFCLQLPQFSGLHKEQTPDPCAVAGIFGCNAGAMTHAARSGAGYVNINGYKVLVADVGV